ncbi:MAG: aminoglycoside 6-adenylyltransferase [Aridibacter sp.]
MRSEKEIFQLILDFAQTNERIRAVVLNGSRTNPNAKKDIFQDYDIIYFVNQIEFFTDDHSWIDIFGERLILQMPDLMTLSGYPNDATVSFAYLMLFKDKNRIDLTLVPVEQIREAFILESLSVLLLDKDKVFSNLPSPDESDYLIEKPGEKEFSDTCNEFWWVSTYVAKGLWRGEITYVKEILENPVRKMFMKIIEWQIGIRTNFSVSFGKSGKNLKQYADPELYNKILSTYPDSKVENIWKSLFLMTDIFNESAKEIGKHFGFRYNSMESLNVLNYLKDVEVLSSSKEKKL